MESHQVLQQVRRSVTRTLLLSFDYMKFALLGLFGSTILFTLYSMLIARPSWIIWLTVIVSFAVTSWMVLSAWRTQRVKQWIHEYSEIYDNMESIRERLAASVGEEGYGGESPRQAYLQDLRAIADFLEQMRILRQNTPSRVRPVDIETADHYINEITLWFKTKIIERDSGRALSRYDWVTYHNEDKKAVPR